MNKMSLKYLEYTAEGPVLRQSVPNFSPSNSESPDMVAVQRFLVS